MMMHVKILQISLIYLFSLIFLLYIYKTFRPLSMLDSKISAAVGELILSVNILRWIDFRCEMILSRGSNIISLYYVYML